MTQFFPFYVLREKLHFRFLSTVFSFQTKFEILFSGIYLFADSCNVLRFLVISDIDIILKQIINQLQILKLWLKFTLTCDIYMICRYCKINYQRNKREALPRLFYN